MKTLIKLLFKIIALPLVPVLFIIGVVMTFLSWLSGVLLTVVSLLFGIGGIILLCQGQVYSGIGVIVIAFLISPFGIPLFTEACAGLIHSLNSSIIGFIAG